MMRRSCVQVVRVARLAQPERGRRSPGSPSPSESRGARRRRSARTTTCDARPVHRDTFLNCPRCGVVLDIEGVRLQCGQCHGKLIPEQALLDQISSHQVQALLSPAFRSKGSFLEFVRTIGPTIASAEPPLACPRCTVVMTKHKLFAIELDRCPAHGMWLEGMHELNDLLASAIEVA